MIFPLLLSILFPLLLGFIFISILFPRQNAGNGIFLMKLSLSSGIGFGVSSLLFFIWLLVFDSNNIFLIVEKVVLLLFIVYGIFFFVKKRKPSAGSQTDRVHPEARDTYNFLTVTFPVVFAISLFVFILFSFLNPHGGWDAWAIWNMRARFIFRAGELWREAFSSLLPWTHPDYPLLIPLSIVRMWKYTGSETTVVPAILAMCFTFSTVLLLVSSITLFRNHTQGYLAGIVLLGTSFFIQQGASEYADVPLGFFFIATLVLFALYDNLSMKSYKILIAAGITAALSAWTKNEGIVFLAALIVARLLAILPLHGIKGFLRQTGFFTLGLLPIMAVIGYFKICLAPSNDLVSVQGADTLSQLIDFPRYMNILKAYLVTGVTFTEGIISLPLLILYFIIIGKNRERDKAIINTSLITLLMMFLFYFFIYVLIPNDPDWHLKYSLNRLFLQLWPSFLFYFFMTVNSPEQVFLKKRDK